MRIKFDINNRGDANEAASMCRVIGDALELDLRHRSFEVKAIGESAAEPVREMRGRKKKKSIEVSNPHPAGMNDVQGDYTVELEEARDQLRTLAKERGVVWMRELLAAHGASRLGDLTDEQVVRALAS